MRFNSHGLDQFAVAGGESDTEHGVSLSLFAIQRAASRIP